MYLQHLNFFINFDSFFINSRNLIINIDYLILIPERFNKTKFVHDNPLASFEIIEVLDILCFVFLTMQLNQKDLLLLSVPFISDAKSQFIIWKTQESLLCIKIQIVSFCDNAIFGVDNNVMMQKQISM